MQKIRYYTGVGSRKTPKIILSQMKSIGYVLENLGYILRTGDASGADNAFSSGVENLKNKIIVKAGENTKASNRMALSVHDNPGAAHRYLYFLGRNPIQVLGPQLNDPSDFLICWTPGGKEVGGTAVTIRIAKLHEVPVYNLATKSYKEIMDSVIPILSSR